MCIVIVIVNSYINMRIAAHIGGANARQSWSSFRCFAFACSWSSCSLGSLQSPSSTAAHPCSHPSICTELFNFQSGLLIVDLPLKCFTLFLCLIGPSFHKRPDLVLWDCQILDHFLRWPIFSARAYRSTCALYNDQKMHSEC